MCHLMFYLSLSIGQPIPILLYRHFCGFQIAHLVPMHPLHVMQLCLQGGLSSLKTGHLVTMHPSHLINLLVK
jgi:hypothetical protein